ncbi:MAG: nitroreductase family protein [Verrucomicrobia bacterium]|nr:nitroreductase family protein [Verrucomicrobiota bacterium]MCG2680539.1 nitroreductase family protein [Kiritimatiellia bacterium]MBU4247929.1 nitroreductase family protein [Verrucomicrobiota bacterium]MBU4289528.1 nitroreductase family protein [Verrucomicrobiota bacterium]MBU4428392.1 nitroreductase family protein [Verrucomicrobiota bacterium]
MADQPQPDASSLSALIQSRWSCREYRPDPVPREAIEKMLDAARWAPSACNRQPWRFSVVTREETRKAIASRGLLPGLSAQWVVGAPVMIVMGMCRAVVTHRVAPWLSGVDYAWIDLGIAGEHLVLQAMELGLGTCWIGWIRPAVIRKIVGWPVSIRPAILFAVGWPEEPSPVKRTDRLPLSDLVQWME